ncbi:unnamed protein product [Ambrosiozyma monospora]|uniref:Unnamed protein product n=1 Tax=Ambrosiozyma monospora TaxID=43982 RepID=A0ACB5STY2_AMBMO|nr:unnamed protein product [Ambrosiozyma monospora]
MAFEPEEHITKKDSQQVTQPETFTNIIKDIPLDIILLIYQHAVTQFIDLPIIIHSVGQNSTWDSILSAIFTNSYLTNWGRCYSVKSVKKSVAFSSPEFHSFAELMKEKRIKLALVDFHAFHDNIEQLFFIADSLSFSKLRLFIDFFHFVEEIPDTLLSLLYDLTTRSTFTIEILIRQDDKDNKDFEFWPITFQSLLPYVTQTLTTVDDDFAEIVGFNFLQTCVKLKTLDLVFHTHYGDPNVLLENSSLQNLMIDLSLAVTNYEFHLDKLPSLRRLRLKKVDCCGEFFEEISNSVRELRLDECFYDDETHRLPKNLRTLTIIHCVKHPQFSNMNELALLNTVQLDFEVSLPKEFLKQLPSSVTKLILKTKLPVPLDYTDDGFGGWIGVLAPMVEDEIYDLSFLNCTLAHLEIKLTVQSELTNEYSTEDPLATISFNFKDRTRNKSKNLIGFFFNEERLTVDLRNFNIVSVESISFSPECCSSIYLGDVPGTLAKFDIDDDSYEVGVLTKCTDIDSLTKCGLIDYLVDDFSDF